MSGKSNQVIAIVVVIAICAVALVYVVEPGILGLQGDADYFKSRVDFDEIDYTAMITYEGGDDFPLGIWFKHGGCASYESDRMYNGKAWEVMFSMTTHNVWFFSGDELGKTPTVVNGAPDEFIDASIAALPLKPATYPHADVDGPYYGYAGEPVTFDASASYDPDGEIVSWKWDFGDGTVRTYRDSDNGQDDDGAIVQHTYTRANFEGHFYLVALEVTDNDGHRAVDSTRAYIYPPENNQPPVADFTWSPQYPQVGQSVTFDASASYDPDGGIAGYAFDFGDGHTIGGQSAVRTHTYGASGTYTVTLQVADNYYDITEISKTITVGEDEPPEPPDDEDGRGLSQDGGFWLLLALLLTGAGILVVVDRRGKKRE